MSDSFASASWYLAPWKVFVDAGLAREPEHPLAEDVAQDLRRAAFDRVRPRTQEHLPGVAAAGQAGLVGPDHLVARIQEPVGVEDVHAHLVDPPVRLGERELGHRAFGTGRSRLPVGC